MYVQFFLLNYKGVNFKKKESPPHTPHVTLHALSHTLSKILSYNAGNAST